MRSAIQASAANAANRVRNPPFVWMPQLLQVISFKFDERRHCGLAGQGNVGVEAVAEPFDLHAVPGQDVEWVQRSPVCL
jgi:hypothetical protein